MELLEAMDEMEATDQAAAATMAPSSPVSCPTTHTAPEKRSSSVVCDFFQQQMYAVHNSLKQQWALQHRSDAASSVVSVPFAWVASRTLRLLEEYPDGLTEAVILTELMTQLHHRERVHIQRALAHTLPLPALLDTKGEGAVVEASIAAYAQHCVTLRSVTDSDGRQAAVESVKMFLHQRFHACIAAFAGVASDSEYPFVAGRRVVFTNAKLTERRCKSDDALPVRSDTMTADNSPVYAFLPSPYVALLLQSPQSSDSAQSSESDRVLTDRATAFPQLDAMVTAALQRPPTSDEQHLQQLVVTARVVDIGAVRPCTASQFHIQRQVILLAHDSVRTAVSSAPEAIGSHVWVLWDDQVALSRLFHVGDVVTIVYPFVHTCGSQQGDPEIAAIFEEYVPQQRALYYLEYGSATTLFVYHQLPRQPLPQLHSTQPPLSANEETPASISIAASRDHDAMGFSVYGHVARIQVSHGIPLLAAFFYAYYDAKTQNRRRPHPGSQKPVLDRAVISRYYLVVLLDLFDAHTSDTLCVELTGVNALKALQLRQGQTVFLEGLVSVDLHGNERIRALRDEKQSAGSVPWQSQASAQSVTPAFPNAAYSPSHGARTALCSDWESLFGKQTDTFHESRLYAVNTIPGLLKSGRVVPHGDAHDPGHGSDFLSHWLRDVARTRQLAILSGRVVVTRVGWLIPPEKDSTHHGTQAWAWDESCQKGFSTMLAHRACRRRLKMAARSTDPTALSGPSWTCGFCHEQFTGMEATIQTYCELVVALDDGSTPGRGGLLAVGHTDTVAVLLGVPAETFSQLSLLQKRQVLTRAIGRQYNTLLSRSEATRTIMQPPSSMTLAPSLPGRGATANSTTNVTWIPARAVLDLRMDLVQPVDTVAAARQVLAQLGR